MKVPFSQIFYHALFGGLGKHYRFIFYKVLSFGMSFSLILLIFYEFLSGKGDDMCRKIVMEALKYKTFVRS